MWKNDDFDQKTTVLYISPKLSHKSSNFSILNIFLSLCHVVNEHFSLYHKFFKNTFFREINFSFWKYILEIMTLTFDLEVSIKVEEDLFVDVLVQTASL